MAIAALTYLIYLLKSKAITISVSDVFFAVKNNLLILLAVLLLMTLNWGLEILKWRYFTQRIQTITLVESIKTILIGIIAGIFTPNRIGELGGRLLYINKQNRASAIYINSLCAISQLITTIIFGLFFFTFISDQIELIHRSSLIVRLFSWLSIVLLLYIFLKGNLLRGIIIKLNAQFNKYRTINFLQFTIRDRVKLLSYSTLRYLVFCFQFILILVIFIPHLNLLDGLVSVALIFFLTTIIPSGWISDLPVRTSFAFIILEFLGYNGTYGSMASVMLWVINLFIPAVLGLVVIREVKWRRANAS